MKRKWVAHPHIVSLQYVMKVKLLVPPSRLTLCDPVDCNPTGSSVHGILQARILEWVAIPFSRGSSQPRNQTQVFCITGRYFTIWATREAHQYVIPIIIIISSDKNIDWKREREREREREKAGKVAGDQIWRTWNCLRYWEMVRLCTLGRDKLRHEL